MESMLRTAGHNDTLYTQSAGKLIVAYHTASWCGPCKMIWPHVLQLANTNPNVMFLKIDVDEVTCLFWPFCDAGFFTLSRLASSDVGGGGNAQICRHIFRIASLNHCA
jgi:thiol-disulfide isomerase/thioredoxin